MDLSAPGVFVFLDNLSGPELSPFARKVERLGYGVLWYTEGVGRESLSLGTYLLTQTERIICDAITACWVLEWTRIESRPHERTLGR